MIRRGGPNTFRSPVAWARRSLLAVAVVALGGASVAFSLSQSLMTDNPALAHALTPYDGQITGRLAGSLVAATNNEVDRRHIDALARRALRQDPGVVPAIVALGLNAQARGDADASKRLFRYAQTLSRRDVATQLWAIEDSVGRGDIPGALRHYDIALRVKPSLGDVLFPVLSSASADPTVRAAVIRTLATEPPWAESFIRYVAAKAPSDATVSLLVGLQRSGVPIPEAARSQVINGLIAAEHIDMAWSYYSVQHPKSDRRRSRDADFTAMIDTPSQFDWVLINDGTMSTSIQRSGKTNLFDYTVPSNAGGPVLQQLQLLPPGRYRLAGRSSGGQEAGMSLPYWTLRCRDGRELGRVTLKSSDGSDVPFEGSFTVPQGCETQTLTLVAQSSDAIAGYSGQILRALLQPE